MHTPAEIFGHTPEGNHPDKESDIEDQRCPFKGGRCSKVSQHSMMEDRDLRFGACSIHHGGRHLDGSAPHIVCPKRIEQDDIMFKDAARVLADPDNFEVVDEVHFAVGHFDFFVVNTDADGTVTDFCGLEPMMVSTTQTGGIIRGLIDYLEDDRTFDDRYDYGINYRQVLGRMESQLFLKGSVVAEMGEQMMWAVQDVFWEYILDNHPVELEEGFDEDKPVGMVVYTLDGDQQSGYDVRRQKEYWGTLDEWLSLLYPKADYTRESLQQKLTEKYGQGTYAAFSDDGQFGV
jgi:hypothetical protein